MVYNVVHFCQELVHSSVISPATHILYNIFAWKKFARKRTEPSMFCFCFLLCNNLRKNFCQNWECVEGITNIFVFSKLRSMWCFLSTIMICYFRGFIEYQQLGKLTVCEHNFARLLIRSQQMF